MDTLINFLSFNESSTLIVTIGIVLVSSASALVGVFIYLRKQALVGDAISHSLLPGVCIGFLLAGEKNIYALLVGALCSGWLSIYGINYISRYTKIKEDAAIGLVLSFFFGLGIMLLTHIQHSGNENQSGLNHIIFGKAAALMRQDLVIFSALSIIILIIVLVLYKEIKVFCFDFEFAQVSGIPVKTIQFILNVLVVMAIVTGVQAVGIVLMAALLITPAVAARFWTYNLKLLIFLSVLFSALSGFIGAFISYIAPSMPTGPWVVVVISFIAACSFFFSPKKGIIALYISKKKYMKKNAEENVLKIFFSLGIEKNDNSQYYSLDDIVSIRYFKRNELKSTIQRLLNKGYIDKNESNRYNLNHYGLKIGKRIMRTHLLWEVYLSDYLSIAPDHVHEDAESIEHLLTNELVAELESKLNYPQLSVIREIEKDQPTHQFKKR